MATYESFDDICITFELSNGHFNITAVKDGDDYFGVGSRSKNGKLLDEVFAKLSVAYRNAGPIQLAVNRDAAPKRIVQDDNWHSAPPKTEEKKA